MGTAQARRPWRACLRLGVLGFLVASCGGHHVPADGGTPDAAVAATACGGLALAPGLTIDADGRTVTLACPAVSVQLSVLDDGIARLRYRGSSAPDGRASYAVIPSSAGVMPTFGGTASSIVACTPSLVVEVKRSDCTARATLADGTVVLEDPAGGGWFEKDGQRGLVHATTSSEHFYGFGEKLGPLDKRGRTMTFFNTDAFDSTYGGFAPDADLLYQSIPFFIGLRAASAYGVFVDDTHRMRFDMGATDPARYEVSSTGTTLDEYVLAGPAMGDVLRRYTQLTGRMPLPPRWALGYHQSRWGYSPGSAVLDIANEFRARQLPADAIWLDIQHMDGFRSFTFDPTAFPDPSAMVSSLGAKGWKTISIVDPGVKVDPAWDVYATGLQNGYFLTEGPQPYVGTVWPGDAAFPDFSSPAVRAWWGTLVPRELAHGVQGLGLDMNEPSNFVMTDAGGTVPSTLPCAGDGVAGTMDALHNVYALNEAHATYDGMRAAAPDRRPFLLTRAGYAGIQRYSAVWTGDAPSTFDVLASTLPDLMGMGLSGVPFVGSDVGGYSGNATPELFARWMQLGALSPFFRGHVVDTSPPQEPWQFGTEVEDISRAQLTERYQLLPYLYSLFAEAAATGAPILRPLVYEFPADETAATLSTEAMLGPWMLSAPVLGVAAQSAQVYLPAGRWYEVGSSAIHDGPTTFTTDVTLGARPTYVREGAIIPRSQPMQWSDEQSISTLYFDLYPASHATTFTLYEDDGVSFAYTNGSSSRVTYTLQGSATGGHFSAGSRTGSVTPAARMLVTRVHRVDHVPTAVRVGGTALPVQSSYDALVAAGSGYFYDDDDLSLVVAFPDRDAFALDMDYDATVTDPAPPVRMTFQVTVPADTPATSTISIASSANGWTQSALVWNAEHTIATGQLSVPRGEWLYYKYTRGDWGSVEDWAGCTTAKNRYGLGAANPVKTDTVWGWTDLCP